LTCTWTLNGLVGLVTRWRSLRFLADDIASRSSASWGKRGKRYQDLHGALDGMSHEVLTDTLRRAECDGLMTRRIDPDRVETATLYELTDLDKSFADPPGRGCPTRVVMRVPHLQKRRCGSPSRRCGAGRRLQVVRIPSGAAACGQVVRGVGSGPMNAGDTGRSAHVPLHLSTLTVKLVEYRVVHGAEGPADEYVEGA
jgi:hypothetical protein